MNKRKTLVLVCIVLIIGLASLSGCSTENNNQEPQKTKVITDMVGREVTLPTTINKACGSGPVETIFIYTINPDKLLGWNYSLNEYEKEYILPKYRDLEAYGMSQNFNTEAIIKAGPEVIIYSGDLNDTTKENADSLQEKIGIPVVVIDGELTNSDKVYTFLGDVLQEEEKAKQLSNYALKVFNTVKNVDVKDEDKVKAYYGNGSNSLNTAPQGTSAAKVFDVVNADNIIADAGTKGRVDVSLEQIISYDPEIMIINGEPKQQLTGNMAVEEIMNNADFSTITAVKNSNVYAIPKVPFSWFDRPSGPNRIIGVVWLSELLYPDYYDFNIKEEVKTFYKLFYHLDLSDEELSDIIILK